MVMKTRLRISGMVAITLIAFSLGGCASYYPTGDRGVYYQVPEYRGSRVTYVDPLLYPFWSLDYFYYSHYYHPYSVLVHRWDPWYYPYPGWYYGYRPGPRFAGHGGRYYYPWYRYPDRYSGYRPWRPGVHLSFGYSGGDRLHPYNRVRQLDDRLRALDTRRAVVARDQRPDRRLLPGASRWLPATGRGAAVRREEIRRTLRNPSGTTIRQRDMTERRTLLDRLRAVDRRARQPERTQRSRDGWDPTPSRSRDAEPRRPVFDSPPRERNRSFDRSPPVNRSQRRPPSEPARSRSTNRQSDNQSDQRERR